jgi:hypothetical protein
MTERRTVILDGLYKRKVDKDVEKEKQTNSQDDCCTVNILIFDCKIES